MESTRSKRQKRSKHFAMIDFEDGYATFPTNKILCGIVAIGEKVTVNWPNKGTVEGTIYGLSDSSTKLLEAKKHGMDGYVSDDDFQDVSLFKTRPPSDKADKVAVPDAPAEITHENDPEWTLSEPASANENPSDVFEPCLTSSLLKVLDSARLFQNNHAQNDQRALSPMSSSSRLNDHVQQNEFVSELKNLTNVLTNQIAPLLQELVNAANKITAKPTSINRQSNSSVSEQNDDIFDTSFGPDIQVLTYYKFYVISEYVH